MRLKKNIATSETGFVFNPSTGDSFSTNPIGAEILLYLKEGLPSSTIKNMLLEKYDVDPKQLEKDWDDYLSQLKDGNLLEQ
jgi:hypothetical protein